MDEVRISSAEIFAQIEFAGINCIATDLAVVGGVSRSSSNAKVAFSALRIRIPIFFCCIFCCCICCPTRSVSNLEISHSVEILCAENRVRNKMLRKIDGDGGISLHTSGNRGRSQRGKVDRVEIGVVGSGGLVLEVIVGNGSSDRELGGDIEHTNTGDCEIVGIIIPVKKTFSFCGGDDVDAGKETLKLHFALAQRGQSTDCIRGRLDVAEGCAHGDGLLRIIAKETADVILGVELEFIEVRFHTGNAHALSIVGFKVGGEEEVLLSEEALYVENRGVRSTGCNVERFTRERRDIGRTGEDDIVNLVFFVRGVGVDRFAGLRTDIDFPSHLFRLGRRVLRFFVGGAGREAEHGCGAQKEKNVLSHFVVGC